MKLERIVLNVYFIESGVKFVIKIPCCFITACEITDSISKVRSIGDENNGNCWPTREHNTAQEMHAPGRTEACRGWKRSFQLESY